jgi:VanZ family protein
MRHTSPGKATRWTVAALVAVVILVASAGPPGSGEPVVLLGIAQDKWLHAAAYAGLAATVGWALFVDYPVRRALVLAVLVAVAYGFAMEVVQAPLAARQFDLADVVADAVGALFAAVGLWVLTHVEEAVGIGLLGRD